MAKAKKNKIKSKVGRSNIPNAVKCELWGASAGRCQFCNTLLFQDSAFGFKGNFSQMAHVHAVSPRGPRHVEGMTKNELNSIDNLMLLCPEHHKMIDDKPDEFFSDMLFKKKQAHEERIRIVTAGQKYRKCKIVSYITSIDKNELKGSIDSFKRALFKEGYASGQDVCIDLASNDIAGKRTKEVYLRRAESLENAFKQRVYDITQAKEVVAIFALGPMPLLIKLGTLLNDQYYAKVFQCHRNGDKWCWKDSRKDVAYIVDGLENLETYHNKVAINISLSAGINNARIVDVVDEGVPIVTLTIDEPCRDFVSQEIIADQFVKTYRDTIEQIKWKANPSRILIFPAMPASLAVRLGQDHMFKTDPELVIFDEDSGTFIETISIGGVNDE